MSFTYILLHLRFALYWGTMVSVVGTVKKNQENLRIRLMIFYVLIIVNECHEKSVTNNCIVLSV